MPWRFGDVEIDELTCELRVGGAPRRLQPQAWAVLEYLVRHRDRVVPKAELLEALWPGAHVTEGSLQRAVSLARGGLGEHGHDLLRTLPKQGYRFIGCPEGAPASADGHASEAVATADDDWPLRPRYAENGGIHLAYYTHGAPRPDGADIVFVSGWTVTSKSVRELPTSRAQSRALSSLGRTIVFDKRGTGQSDRPKDLPDLPQRMSDLVVILDELCSEHAILIGVSEGGPLSLLFAATYPERTRGVVLGGSFPRMGRAPGYPHGWPREAIEQLRGYIRRDWGRGATVAAVFGGMPLDDTLTQWAARAELEGASPGAALELLEMNLQCDVRDVLADVHAPVHLVHSVDDPVVAIGASEYLAAHLPNAELERRPGTDHAFLLAEPRFWADRVERVLARSGVTSAG